MATYTKILLFLVLAFALKTNGKINKYFRSLYLDPENRYRLSWKFNNETITFKVQVNAIGWVGLGFSPDGAMTGSDIVVCWIDENGDAKISDRFAMRNGFPEKDTHQDYTLLRGKKSDTGMSFKFIRMRNTCDDQDNEISTDATRLIYAFSNVVPESEDMFTKHAFNDRGTRTVYLFDPPNVQLPLPADVVSVDFLTKNITIPDDYHTFYWCEVVEMPDLGKPHHMIRYEPVLQAGHEHLVHHITLSQCGESMKEFVGKGEACFDLTMTNFTKPFVDCTNNMVIAWAVGGEAYSYPDGVGVELIGERRSKYFLLQIHYDNSGLQSDIEDSSGLKLYLTPTLRKHSAAKMFIAAGISPAYQILPPGQEAFTTYVYCSADCMNEIPENGWTVLTVFVHEHKTGVKGRLRHIRDGVLLDDIVNDQHYNFDFQNTRILNKEVKIMPGDELVAECVYNTVDRENITFGGFSTREEMCYIFLDVYPLKDTFACYSAPAPSDTLKMFGADISNDNTTVILSEDGEKNMTLEEFALTKIHFNSSGEVEQYQNAVRDSKHLIWCGIIDDSVINKSTENTTSDIFQVFQMKFQHGYPKVETVQVSTEQQICLLD